MGGAREPSDEVVESALRDSQSRWATEGCWASEDAFDLCARAIAERRRRDDSYEKRLHVFVLSPMMVFHWRSSREQQYGGAEFKTAYGLSRFPCCPASTITITCDLAIWRGRIKMITHGPGPVFPAPLSASKGSLKRNSPRGTASPLVTNHPYAILARMSRFP